MTKITARNKLNAPGILLAIAVTVAFLIGAIVNHEAHADDLTVVEDSYPQ